LADPIASVIIPVYNQAETVLQAVSSALAQTVPCEIVVIDDGSTDDGNRVIDRFLRSLPPQDADRCELIYQTHAGPSVARNAGLVIARGEFVMFLDADDVMHPEKIARQIAAFTPEIGWVISDVEIQDAARQETILASRRYRYQEKDIGGWIAPLLRQANFIPIMAPLVRRSVLEHIRFDDRLVPEDWHFWVKVADAARVRYLPDVLATYRKSRTGRSRRPPQSRHVSPNLTLPLRLNLGCGRPASDSWHPIDGMENLDRHLGWHAEAGLGDFVDQSVDGVTISHLCMYLPIDAWALLFSEIARVLAEGGVVRITEDDSEHPASARHGGWRGSEPAITPTSAARLTDALARVGLVAEAMTATTTHYRDRSLLQAHHGEAPDVCFVEGRKLPGTLFAPHSDDEALFASFIVLRYRPRVVICFPSAGDYGDTSVREAETREAMLMLGAGGVEQWNGWEIEHQMRAYDARVHPIRVWAPDALASHPDHQIVALAALNVFGDRVSTYHTYIDGEKVRSDRPIPFELPWIAQKLRALSRYQSQLTHPRAHAFFLNDLREYWGLHTARHTYEHPADL
jgi:LmbE family N-acetylglucosaminyl deacetylase